MASGGAYPGDPEPEGGDGGAAGTDARRQLPDRLADDAAASVGEGNAGMVGSRLRQLWPYPRPARARAAVQ